MSTTENCKWYIGDKELLSFDNKYIGFIYLITNLTNGKKYVGRKSFFSVRNVKVSKKKYLELKKLGKNVSKKRNKKTKSWNYRKEVKKETDWRCYCGSSEDLKKDIKNGDPINKEIIHLCTNKKQMTYFETKYQMCLGVIEENKDDFYNKNILGKYFEKDFDTCLKEKIN